MSIKDQQMIQAFFEEEVKNGHFQEIKVSQPYYIGKGISGERKWYATKWYRCSECGCLWEFNYPDFPAKGFVRKFSDGKYYEKG